MSWGAGVASLSDGLLDAVCLIGPVEKCQQRLAEFRAAGVDMPILKRLVKYVAAAKHVLELDFAALRAPAITRKCLMPPIGVDGVREVIAAFSRSSDTASARGAAQLSHVS